MRTACKITLALLSVGSLSCDGGEEDRSLCGTEEAGSIVLAFTEPLADARVSGEVTVRGTADQTADLAIHSIAVAGRVATSSTFNFGTWEVRVPSDALPASTDGRKEIRVTATDTCGTQASMTRVVEIFVPPTDLSISEPTYAGPPFAPATKPIPITLVATASPSSRGAVLMVAPPPGWTLVGAPDGLVSLGGDGVGVARATLMLTCSADSELSDVLVVRSGSVAPVTRHIRCAGPPKMSVGDKLVPGGSTRVDVIVDGDLAGCQAAPNDQVTVTSGDANLMASTTVTDTNADGFPDIRVAAAATSTIGSKARILCWDSYLQTTTREVEVEAP